MVYSSLCQTGSAATVTEPRPDPDRQQSGGDVAETGWAHGAGVVFRPGGRLLEREPGTATTSSKGASRGRGGVGPPSTPMVVVSTPNSATPDKVDKETAPSTPSRRIGHAPPSSRSNP
jgi:hypothetical protein